MLALLLLCACSLAALWLPSGSRYYSKFIPTFSSSLAVDLPLSVDKGLRSSGLSVDLAQ